MNIFQAEKKSRIQVSRLCKSFTILFHYQITPESSPATIEFPVPESTNEPEKVDDDVKPDFGQSDNIDVDPNQGAINMAFDDNDEATGEGDEEEDDEVSLNLYL